MFVKQYGSGSRTFLGFHGWSGDHRTFDALLPYLPANCNFYSFDLPGCGNSPAPPEWTMESITEQITNAVLDIGRHPYTLIGSCSGAIFGLAIAKQNPALFHRLVLVDPFASMPWYFSIFLNKHFGRQAYTVTFANPIGRWITNVSLRMRRIGQTDLTGSFEQVNHDTVYQYLKILGGIASAEQFRGITIPIDLLYGEHTFRAVKDSIAIWKKIFPQALTYELQTAGHLPIEEASEQLARILFSPQCEER